MYRSVPEKYLQHFFIIFNSQRQNEVILHLLKISFMILLKYDFQYVYYLNIQMINKLPKKKQKVESEQSEEGIAQNFEQPQPKDLQFFPKMLKKQALFVHFTGTIQSGFFHDYDSLSLKYTIAHGHDWNIKSGQKSGISQFASSNGSRIVWNLPFEMSFETTYLVGWPQIIVQLYGTDFFGRSFVRGYGNVHLPSTSGMQQRKVRVFQPLPQSTISGLFGYLSGTIAQYKQPQKVLGTGEGRQVTRVKTIGQITIKVETTKHNFSAYGYS